uniref:Uncharacterized protein n=1 Tax=Arundo donax TaxID=35708 RepID=A0A0A9BS43_ARUDO
MRVAEEVEVPSRDIQATDDSRRHPLDRPGPAQRAAPPSRAPPFLALTMETPEAEAATRLRV